MESPPTGAKCMSCAHYAHAPEFEAQFDGRFDARCVRRPPTLVRHDTHACPLYEKVLPPVVTPPPEPVRATCGACERFLPDAQVNRETIGAAHGHCAARPQLLVRRDRPACPMHAARRPPLDQEARMVVEVLKAAGLPVTGEAPAAVVARLVEERQKRIQAEQALAGAFEEIVQALTTVLDLSHDLNCVCGRGKLRLPASVRTRLEDARRILMNR